MKLVTTADNSVTFFNEQYQETYHSSSGALEEAFEKFAKPCNLQDGMSVLDICFGLGYNSLAAISLANVSIVGLENDQAILDTVQEIELENENYDKIKQLAKDLEYEDDKISMKLIVGNALETVKELDEGFDAVFLDPFSPKKCPELWTAEFFKDIYKVMKSGGILTTYSCASAVRKNLEEAGFTAKDGPTVGRRSPATIATK